MHFDSKREEKYQLKAGPKKLRKSWTPPKLKLVLKGITGEKSLEAVNDYSEEVAFFGLKMLPPKSGKVKLSFHSYKLRSIQVK